MVIIRELPRVVSLHLADHVLEVIDHSLGLSSLGESICEETTDLSLEFIIGFDIDAQENGRLATLSQHTTASTITGGSLLVCVGHSPH